MSLSVLLVIFVPDAELEGVVGEPTLDSPSFKKLAFLRN